MALILICAGCLLGFVAALAQWLFLGVGLLAAAGTYFAIGIGFPVAVMLLGAVLASATPRDRTTWNQHA